MASFMLDYALVQALAKVISEGSFERAARRLAITPSAVSQRVRLLEERAGTALVVRGQPCRATEAGRRLCRHAAEVALLEEGLRGDLERLLPGEDAPTVRIAVNADSLAAWILPALAKVEGRLFDLLLDDEDHTAEWLRRGEVLAAVSTSPGPIAGCSVRPLGSLVYVATASPAFAARWFPAGVTLDALARAPSLLFNRKDRLQDRWAAAQFGASPLRPRHLVPSSQGFIDAVLADLGWGMNVETLVETHVAAGRMVRLGEGRPLAVPLFWHWGRAVDGPLKGLTQAVVDAARASLSQQGG